MEQKNMLVPGTSVNGRVVVAPPQVPVSARRRVDAMVMTSIEAIISVAPNRERLFSFMCSPSGFAIDQVSDGLDIKSKADQKSLQSSDKVPTKF